MKNRYESVAHSLARSHTYAHSYTHTENVGIIDFICKNAQRAKETNNQLHTLESTVLSLFKNICTCICTWCTYNAFKLLVFKGIHTEIESQAAHSRRVVLIRFFSYFCCCCCYRALHIIKIMLIYVHTHMETHDFILYIFSVVVVVYVYVKSARENYSNKIEIYNCCWNKKPSFSVVCMYV